VASRKNHGFGINRATENPASPMPSSPFTRFWVTSGRSAHGITWLCSVFTFPNAARIFPAFTSNPPGNAGNVMKPSSSSTPSSPNEMKKSARAYGSTTAWNEASGLVHLHRRRRVHRVVSRGPEEIANHRPCRD
jgi:hypothetical protein